MAVRDRSYRPYGGLLTGDRWRFLVIPRYAYEEVFQSKRFLTVFIASIIWPAVSVVLIYLHHNIEALDILSLRPQDLLAIDGEFFRRFYLVQGPFAFIMAFLLGPTLVSVDLTHNGLPLYLARPFSRAEYLLGKLSVLAILLSLVTWIPALALFAFQTALEGVGWAAANIQLAGSIFAAAWIGIAFMSLLTVAISAWVRWRSLARGVLFGLFAFTTPLAEIINELFRTDWGSVLNPAMMMATIWDGLFGVRLTADIPLWGAWASILTLCLVSLFLLERKVRAYEVVR